MSEFEQLRQFIEDQEQLLLARLEQLQKQVIKEEKIIVSRLSEEISNLSDLIAEIEEKHKQPMSEFLQVRVFNKAAILIKHYLGISDIESNGTPE